MKKKNLFYIILLGVVVVACLWAFISAGFITKKFNHQIENDDLMKKEVNIENLLVTETENGEKLWELFSEYGHYDNVNNVVYLSDIIGNLYKNKVVIASFKADRGTYNNDKKQIVLQDNVFFIHKDGENLRATRVIWTKDDDKITASGNIRLEKPNEVIIYGTEGYVNKEFSDMEITGRTKTQFYLKSKDIKSKGI